MDKDRIYENFYMDYDELSDSGKEGYDKIQDGIDITNELMKSIPGIYKKGEVWNQIFDRVFYFILNMY